MSVVVGSSTASLFVTSLAAPRSKRSIFVFLCVWFCLGCSLHELRVRVAGKLQALRFHRKRFCFAPFVLQIWLRPLCWIRTASVHGLILPMHPPGPAERWTRHAMCGCIQ